MDHHVSNASNEESACMDHHVSNNVACLRACVLTSCTIQPYSSGDSNK
jgi:hypothetical protein